LVGDTSLIDRWSRQIKRVQADGGIEHVFDYPKSPDDDLMFQCLMLADKYDAEPEIEDHLRQGRFVVCDRWKDSSRAYGAADGLSPEWLERIHRRLTSAAMTVLLEIPEEVALARRPALRDRYEKDRDKQVVVALRYAELAKNGRWQVINGNQSVEQVSESIWFHVAKRFGL
jgi:thymidylate kinase